MYNDFYGFKQAPFNLTPDPRYLFMSERHREAYNHMLYGIKERKGFILLTGDVGAGKTTLCRKLLENLGPECVTALILNPQMDEMQLLGAILAEFGLRAPRDRNARLERLNEFLLAQAAAGKDVVLIIDEAQNMSLELLEQVRMLSNLETHERKLLQIVLMGQPELRRKIDDHRLRQLRQRISVRYHLRPLSRTEVEEYVLHRLQISGASRMPTFNFWAMRKVYGYSGGVPRLINAVCDKTLLCGFVNGSEHFTRAHVTRAIRELEGKAA